MFESLSQVPEPIKHFYEEAEIQESVIVQLKTKGRIESVERLKLFVERGVDEHIKGAALGVINAEAWQFHDDYIDWLNSEPKEPELLRDEAGLYVKGEEGNDVYIDGYTPEQYQEDLEQYKASEPVEVARTLDDVLAETNYHKQKEKARKLKGVEFEGVMCSATKEDMWGLNSVQGLIAAGQTVRFDFDNGNKLLLSPENYIAFQEVWIPFRQSFYPID